MPRNYRCLGPGAGRVSRRESVCAIVVHAVRGTHCGLRCQSQGLFRTGRAGCRYSPWPGFDLCSDDGRRGERRVRHCRCGFGPDCPGQGRSHHRAFQSPAGQRRCLDRDREVGHHESRGPQRPQRGDPAGQHDNHLSSGTDEKAWTDLGRHQGDHLAAGNRSASVVGGDDLPRPRSTTTRSSPGASSIPS